MSFAQDTPETNPDEEAPAASETMAQTAIQSNLVIKVDNREAAIETVIAEAEKRGGWFASLSKDGVSLRLPAADSEAFIETIRPMGDVVDRTFSSEDLGDQMERLSVQLAASEEVLERYMEVMETARSNSVIAVEREITRVIQQIETLKGQMRVLSDRSQYARIQVSFQFRERRAPTRDGASSFEWLNTLNVADLLDDFQYGYRSDRSGVTGVAPEGFAPYAKDKRFQALSPDDVVYRIRRAKNDPVADLTFWKEAMRTRMLDAGYHLLTDTEIQANGKAGTLLELGAANGEQDQTYLIGLFVRGADLIIVEASGESERFAARREAVVKAIEGIAF